MLDDILVGVATGVGVAIGLWWLSRRSRSVRKDLERLVFSDDTEAARPYLDAKLPPRVALSYFTMMGQRERMAGLALLGDLDALRRESVAHRGSLLSLARVNGIAYFGQALIDVASPNDLQDLAERVERDGGLALFYIKKTTRALADLAEAVSTGRLPDQSRRVLPQMMQEGELVAILLRKGCMRAAIRRGYKADEDQLRHQLGPWAADPALTGVRRTSGD